MIAALANVLVAPIVSEKSTRVQDRENTVVFWVVPKATKREIKLAVEAFFQVKVVSVNTLVQGAKRVRFAGHPGRTKKQKKAYVQLAPGHAINFAQ